MKVESTSDIDVVNFNVRYQRFDDVELLVDMKVESTSDISTLFQRHVSTLFQRQVATL